MPQRGTHQSNNRETRDYLYTDSMDRKCIGKLGEEIGVKYLEKNGHQVVETNFYSRFGEIDIISKKDRVLIFIEVKTRTSDRFGTPEEALTRQKLHKIRKTALHFMKTRDKPLNFNWRIDLITVRLKLSQKTAHIKHFKNV